MKFVLLFLIGLFCYIFLELFKFSAFGVDEFNENRLLEDRYYEYDEEDLIEDDFDF